MNKEIVWEDEEKRILHITRRNIATMDKDFMERNLDEFVRLTTKVSSIQPTNQPNKQTNKQTSKKIPSTCGNGSSCHSLLSFILKNRFRTWTTTPKLPGLNGTHQSWIDRNCNSNHGIRWRNGSPQRFYVHEYIFFWGLRATPRWTGLQSEQ